jgi:hypothetical protein
MITGIIILYIGLTLLDMYYDFDWKLSKPNLKTHKSSVCGMKGVKKKNNLIF